MNDDADQLKLTPDFQQNLIRDGFVDCVGVYEIRGNCHKIEPRPPVYNLYLCEFRRGRQAHTHRKGREAGA